MNWRFWNRRYYLASIYTLIVAGLLITYWKSFTHPSNFTLMPLVWPFLIGLSLAYLLNFLLTFLERKIKRRAVSLALTYTIVLVLILAFVLIIAPQVSTAMGHFVEDFPDFSEQIMMQVETQLGRFDLTEDHVGTVRSSMDDLINRFVTFNQTIVPTLVENLVMIGETLKNIVLGIVMSIYILAKKEMLQNQCSKLVMSMIGMEKEKVLVKWLRRAHQIFRLFFAGMLLNSLIVGVITTVSLFVFRIPFALLIGFIVAITNMIPIFGPFIGAIPATIMIFFVSPTKAVIFVVLILIIQQIDANIITPKILGDKIGIASIWVLVAIIVFGYFFGIVGLLLGVPITALLIEIAREIVNNRLVRMHKIY